MVEKISPEFFVRAATDIAVAYLSKSSIERSEISPLLREIGAALESLLSDAETEEWPRGSEATLGPADIGKIALETLSISNVSPPVRLARQEPAVPVSESITEEYIISLEDGGRYRSLRRHLMAKYGMTPDDYRRKWNLPRDYPMAAPSYAKERSAVAKRTGLGRSASPAKNSKATPARSSRRKLV